MDENSCTVIASNIFKYGRAQAHRVSTPLDSMLTLHSGTRYIRQAEAYTQQTVGLFALTQYVMQLSSTYDCAPLPATDLWWNYHNLP